MKQRDWVKDAKALALTLLYFSLFFLVLSLAFGGVGGALAAFKFFFLPAVFGFVALGTFFEDRRAARENWPMEKCEWRRGLCHFLTFLPIFVTTTYNDYLWEHLGAFGEIALYGATLIFLGFGAKDFGAKGIEAGSLEKIVKDVWAFLLLWLLFCLFIYGLRAWVQAQEAAAV